MGRFADWFARHIIGDGPADTSRLDHLDGISERTPDEQLLWDIFAGDADAPTSAQREERP